MTSDNHSMAKFLDGLRVIDLSRLLPGPFATMLLADMGADVIKVEDPHRGDYARYYPPMVGMSSAFFHGLNRNKRAVTVDLKKPEGTELLARLLATADVLVESFRPGVLDRLGFGKERLQEQFPELVVCSITGYGQSGQKRDHAGHDINYLALSGLLNANGSADGPPQVPGFQVADIAGGALYGALGVVSALYRRTKTRQGAYLDISMTEGAMSLMIPTIARHAAGSKDARGQGMLSGGLPSYQIYATADGRHLAVGALEPKFWNPFVELIGASHLQGQSMIGGERGEAIAAELTEIIGRRTLAEWMATFGDADICVEPIQDLDEVLASTLHKTRQAFFELQGITHVATPLTARDVEHRPPPQLGAHNEQIYGELGVTDEELAAYDADDVI